MNRPPRRGAASQGGLCSRNATTLLIAFLIALPLASVISLPLSIVLARSRGSDEPNVVESLSKVRGVDTSGRRLRSETADEGSYGEEGEEAQEAAPPRDTTWRVPEALSFALIGEPIRLETVLVDFGATRHYSSLCDQTKPVDYLLGGIAEYDAPPVVQFRAPDKANPITCASGNIFMVDMRDDMVADDLISYIFREEPWSIELWVSILSADRCRKMDANVGPHACRANWEGVVGGRRPLVVDFGANHGFFGLLAARMGYDVIAVDPQPHCAEYVRVAATAAEFSSAAGGRLKTVNAFLAENGKLEGGNTSIDISVRTGCWGSFPQPDAQYERVRSFFGQFRGGNDTVTVPVLDPMDLIGDEETDVVVMMKIVSGGLHHSDH